MWSGKTDPGFTRVVFYGDGTFESVANADIEFDFASALPRLSKASSKKLFREAVAEALADSPQCDTRVAPAEPSSHTKPDGLTVGGASTTNLSEYELKRLENIERNKRALEALGLSTGSDAGSRSSPNGSSSTRPAAAKRRKTEQASSIRRKSPRLGGDGKPPQFTAQTKSDPISTCDGDFIDDDEEGSAGSGGARFTEDAARARARLRAGPQKFSPLPDFNMLLESGKMPPGEKVRVCIAKSPY